MRKSALALAVVSSSFAFAYADTYDKRLEYVETTGTQWIDTGIHFNYRRSVFRAVFRILEQPTSFSTICGATDVADSNIGYSSGKYLATTLNVTKRSNGNYVILPSFTGGDSDGYLWPVTGSYDVNKSIEVESDVAVAYCNGRDCGKNQSTGVGYNHAVRSTGGWIPSMVDGGLPAAETSMRNGANGDYYMDSLDDLMEPWRLCFRVAPEFSRGVATGFEELAPDAVRWRFHNDLELHVNGTSQSVGDMPPMSVRALRGGREIYFADAAAGARR